MSKQKIKKIRTQAIIDVLLYQAFVILSAGIMVYGILF